MRLPLLAAGTLFSLSLAASARAEDHGSQPGLRADEPRAAQGPLPALPPGVVRLHVDSPVPVQVIEHLGVTDTHYGSNVIRVWEQYQTICVSPCDKIVDAREDHPFQITSPEFPDPKLFGFTGLSGDVTLTVVPGSNARRSGGILMTVLGGASFFVGAIAVPLNFAGHAQSSPGFRSASVAMLVAGSGVLAGGIALIVTSRTQVEIRQRGHTTARAPRYWMGEF